MIADLHCHTRLSDGSMSIDDLVYYAKRAGLDFLAVTDHDTMDGVTRAAVLGKRYGIGIVPGAEISCFDGKRGRPVHLLCYLPDKPDRLQGLFGQMLESRTRAGKRMIRAVKRYYPVTDEHIGRYTGSSKSIYANHILQALMDLGYDEDGSLYQKLFGKAGICAYQPDYPDVREALDGIREAGGVAVLAHPSDFDSMDLLEELAGEGLLQGVEVYHPRVGQPDLARIEAIAEEFDLLRTGGSDFHGSLGQRPCPIASRVVEEKWIHALFGRKKMMPKA